MLLIDELEELNLFLQDNALYLALGAVLLIILVIVFIFLSGRKKRSNEDFEPLFLSLGGFENILSAEVRGSRLALRLKDDSKAHLNDLPKNLVSNYIKMTGKLILVVGQNGEKIEQMINKKAG